MHENSTTQSEARLARWVARVKAPPVDGKANAAVIALLAKHFGLRKAQVHIKSGASGRMKLVARGLTRMITLYTFGPAFELPDPSPFVMKAEMLLKLAKLDYQANTRGFLQAPKGKLPYIDDDGTVVADSTLIRMHLEQKYSIDFDRGLSARDRAVAWATEKMLEDHVYWVLVYWRWMKDGNFQRGPGKIFKRAPAFIRPLIRWSVRRRVRRNLHAHGISRHNEEDMTRLSNRAFDALSTLLGDNKYLMGNEPCGADATAFAFIAGALSPVFESPAHDKARTLPNLMAYRDRMMAEFYGVRPHFLAKGAGPR